MQRAAIERANSAGGRIFFGVGVTVYFASFFLPSINQMAGWECAGRSLSVMLIPRALANPFGLLVLLAGLANPAMATYAWIRLFVGHEDMRLRFAIAAFAFAITSCLFLLLTRLGEGNAPLAIFRPQYGYFVWLCGMLLMIGGDLLGAIIRYVRIEE
jgi:hypothetical protein